MPDGQQPAAELMSALTQLMRTSRATAHRQSQSLGPSGTPLGLLKALRDGDARPGDLAVRLCVAPSVVSRAVVPLEASGLIERRHDPDDARAWRLGLTALGAAASPRCRPRTSSASPSCSARGTSTTSLRPRA